MHRRIRPGAPITRRRFTGMTAGVLASATLGEACQLGSDGTATSNGRLAARPVADVKTAVAGSSPLGLDAGRDAILRIPPDARSPLPLLVMLHGAGGRAQDFLQWFAAAADAAGIALLVPDARSSTWDAIRGGFGRDVAFLDRALERVFQTAAVDPERVAVGGFSDGATYALSLGLINGDLFRRIVAFSPGFFVDGTPAGKPRCFVSHGVSDTILPIDRCGRPVVATLKRRGYDVTFREFPGGHDVPEAIAAEAFGWVAATSPAAVRAD